MAEHSVSLSAKSIQPSSILTGLRRVWFVLAVYLFITFVITIPGTYAMLQTPCTGSFADCLSPAWQFTLVASAAQSGLPLQASALYFTTLYTVVSLIFWAVGFLIFRSQSGSGFALLTAYLMVILGAGGVSLVFVNGAPFSILPQAIIQINGWILLSVYQFISLFFLTFPNGKVYSRWSALPFVLICLNTFFWITPTPLNMGQWPDGLGGIWILLVFGSHVVVQIVRYRRMYTPLERQQTKWLVYIFGICVVAQYILSSLEVTPALSALIGGTTVTFLYLPIALGVGIAIFRYRLWDIDVIIQRTVVYASLTAVVVGIYVLIVGILSALFQSSGSTAISLVATGVVAVSFQRLREQIQRIIDRYIFGERHNPYAVISRLNERLESNISPGTLLPGIAETVAQALKLPYVAIALKNGDHFKTDAVYGQPVDQGRITAIPLQYAQEIVGQMVIGQVAGDKTLDGAERQLLENIARQTGIAAHAVQLSIALQQSRQHIVTAREEERRRLRRDLHDGLGPTLAAQTIKVGAARALIENHPQTAAAILTELETSLATSMIDIRRLVYDLRPPALDQFGLVGAIGEFVQQFSDKGIIFRLEMPEKLPPLPAAVEVAAYRIVQEAINNVIRHSRAQNCRIFIDINGELTISVQDDGVGLPTEIKHGIGLNSIRERVEELGGSLTFTSQQGTQLEVRISL